MSLPRVKLKVGISLLARCRSVADHWVSPSTTFISMGERQDDVSALILSSASNAFQHRRTAGSEESPKIGTSCQFVPFVVLGGKFEVKLNGKAEALWNPSQTLVGSDSF